MDKKKKRSRDIAVNRDEYFMALARIAAVMCRNPSEQHGAVFVAGNGKDWSSGVDTMPSCMHDGAWDDELVVGAEIKAMQGMDCAGGTLYITRTPTLESLAQAMDNGVKRVVYMATVPLSEKIKELSRLSFVPLEEFKGDNYWLRDHVKSIEQRGF